VDDYVGNDSALGLTSYPYTLSAWMRPDTSTYLIGVWVGDKDDTDTYSSIGIDSPDAVSFYYMLNTRHNGANDQIFSSVQPGDGKWRHIVGIFRSATDREVFVDGVSGGTDSTSHLYPLIDRWNIGRHGDSTPSDYMDGVIDDVRIYSRALSAQEVLQLYNMGK